MPYVGIGILLVACVGVIYATRGYLRDRWLYDYLFKLMALIYGIGLGFKYVAMGPEFLRFWVADVGFAAAWTYIIVGLRNPPSHLKPGIAVMDYRIAATKTAQKVLVAMVLAAYVFEGVSTHLAKLQMLYFPETKMRMGGFDWWDLLAYTAGGAVSWWLLRQHAAWLTSARAMFQRRQTESQAARAPKPGQRSHRYPKKK